MDPWALAHVFGVGVLHISIRCRSTTLQTAVGVRATHRLLSEQAQLQGKTIPTVSFETWEAHLKDQLETNETLEEGNMFGLMLQESKKLDEVKNDKLLQQYETIDHDAFNLG
jgi:hypothetical protein